MEEDFTGVNSLSGKVIVLGVSGSIAAYKAADLTSELRKAGAEIFIAMTESATRFITPLTLGTLSRNPVASSLWNEDQAGSLGILSLRTRQIFFWSPLQPQTN